MKETTETTANALWILDDLTARLTVIMKQVTTALAELERLKMELGHEPAPGSAEAFSALLDSPVMKLVGKSIGNVDKPKRTKKPKAPSAGSTVWDAYSAAYFTRYGHEPIRNSMTNSQAAALVGRLGVEDARAVVEFYVQQNDQFYVLKCHPLGFCLKDAEGLYSRWKTGNIMTTDKARTIEKSGASVNASLKYLQKKHTNGGTDGSST